MEYRTLSQISLFAGLSDAQMERVMSKTTLHDYKKYEMILFEDQLETRFFICSKVNTGPSRHT